MKVGPNCPSWQSNESTQIQPAKNPNDEGSPERGALHSAGLRLSTLSSIDALSVPYSGSRCSAVLIWNGVPDGIRTRVTAVKVCLAAVTS